MTVLSVKCFRRIRFPETAFSTLICFHRAPSESLRQTPVLSHYRSLLACLLTMPRPLLRMARNCSHMTAQQRAMKQNMMLLHCLTVNIVLLMLTLTRFLVVPEKKTLTWDLANCHIYRQFPLLWKDLNLY